MNRIYVFYKGLELNEIARQNTPNVIYEPEPYSRYRITFIGICLFLKNGPWTSWYK